MSDIDRAHCLALADCLDNPVASDGTFLGLTDSALAAKALRLFAASLGPVEARMTNAAPAELPGRFGGLPAPSLPGAATARPEHA